MRHGQATAGWSAALVVVGLWAGACASGQGTAPGVASGEGDAVAERVEPAVVLGRANQRSILARTPDWVGRLASARPDPEVSRRLAGLAPDTEVEVFFGSWCSDSRRELTRLWRALEIANGEAGFPIRYIGVDRAKKQPAELLEGRDIVYVPTLIVSRAGVEVGRIVESSPNGVEVDLLALVAGDAGGVISLRTDLEPPAGAGDDP